MKVAVAGLGWWGQQIIRTLGASPKFQVIAAMDPYRPESANALLEERGINLENSLDNVLARDDVEGVILATPHSLHEEQVLAALAAGKQVFCEKPLAMTSDGARRMLASAAQRGRVLGIGHERRYETAIQELMRLVRDGELGQLLHLEANISHDLFRKLDTSNWRLDQKHAPAGMMTAVGIHVTDIFVALAGPAASVRTLTDSMVFTPPAQDYVTTNIAFRSGARATLTFLSSTPFHGRIAIFGDKGWAELVSEGNVDKGLPTHLTVCKGTDQPRQHTAHAANDAVLANFEAWADATKGLGTYPFTHGELLENIKLFEAIVASGKQSGQPVMLQPEHAALAV